MGAEQIWLVKGVIDVIRDLGKPCIRVDELRTLNFHHYPINMHQSPELCGSSTSTPSFAIILGSVGVRFQVRRG